MADLRRWLDATYKFALKTPKRGIVRRALAEGIVLAPSNVFGGSQTTGQFLRFNVAQSGQQRIFDFLRGSMECCRSRYQMFDRTTQSRAD